MSEDSNQNNNENIDDFQPVLPKKKKKPNDQNPKQNNYKSQYNNQGHQANTFKKNYKNNYQNQKQFQQAQHDDLLNKVNHFMQRKSFENSFKTKNSREEDKQNISTIKSQQDESFQGDNQQNSFRYEKQIKLQSTPSNLEIISEEEFKNLVKNCYLPIYINLYNVEFSATRDEVQSFYKNCNIKQILKNNHKQGNFDLILDNYKDAIDVIEKGTGRFLYENEYMLFIKGYRTKPKEGFQLFSNQDSYKKQQLIKQKFKNIDDLIIPKIDDLQNRNSNSNSFDKNLICQQSIQSDDSMKSDEENKIILEKLEQSNNLQQNQAEQPNDYKLYLQQGIIFLIAYLFYRYLKIYFN